MASRRVLIEYLPLLCWWELLMVQPMVHDQIIVPLLFTLVRHLIFELGCFVCWVFFSFSFSDHECATILHFSQGRHYNPLFCADERLNDIVGSAYYVAPEVLHRSYSTEADIWSIGVITYILLCGSRPFWARTESGIFRAVLRADPNFDDAPWPSVSPEAKDFVKRLLNKDHRKRMTAAQALSMWLPISVYNTMVEPF